MTTTRLRVICGDCLDVKRQLPDNSVDSVVTDPPYGLEFMGKEWDSFAPRDRRNATVWDGRRQAQGGWQDDAEARSGKGGGGPSYKSSHKGAKRCTVCGKRAFSGSPCKCKDPHWIIEHRQEAPSAMIAFQAWCEEWSRECYRVLKPGGHMLAFGGTRTWHRLACAVEDAGFEVRDSIAWLYGSGFPKSLDVSKAIDKAAGAEREATGSAHGARNGNGQNVDYGTWGSAKLGIYEQRDFPATDDARTWQGAEAGRTRHGGGIVGAGSSYELPDSHGEQPAGRWPANVVLDESQADALDQQSGISSSGSGPLNRNTALGIMNDDGWEPKRQEGMRHPGKGGASRFFYCAKAPKSERPDVDGVKHPTVKPLTLMRWLVKLVTPPGGTVLEPFAGSGATVEACILEGLDVVAIEREADYLPLIMQRVDRLSR